ncbi:MAG TPA: hypothetical protein VGK87_15270, partial [Anaerolineae bacterium]
TEYESLHSVCEQAYGHYNEFGYLESIEQLAEEAKHDNRLSCRKRRPAPFGQSKVLASAGSYGKTGHRGLAA